LGLLNAVKNNNTGVERRGKKRKKEELNLHMLKDFLEVFYLVNYPKLGVKKPKPESEFE